MVYMITVRAKCRAIADDAFRHTPSHLDVYVYHEQRTTIDHRDLTKFDVVLTTYETVLSDASRSKNLQAIFWFRVVLDEGISQAFMFPHRHSTDHFFL